MNKCKMLRKGNMIILGIVFTFTLLQAQSPEELLRLQQQKLEQVYAQEHGNMGELIQGKIHRDYFNSAKGNPFWLSADWEVGSLETKHLVYSKLLLKYDAYLDALVFAVNPIDQIYIRVNENQVKSFWIQEKQFDYLEGEEKTAMKDGNLIPGYFELLYEGKSKLYAKREKRFKEFRDDYDYVGEFYEKSFYYLFRDQTFWTIRGKKDLIQFTEDHKAELELYIKQQGIHFRSMTDEQLVQLITYYDSL